MIPASYLFKTAYDQAWTYPDKTPDIAAVSNHPTHHIDGLLSPIVSLIGLLLRSVNRPAHQWGSFAHD